MTVDAPFSSVSEADAAYYGDDGGSGDGSGDGDDTTGGRSWTEPEQIPTEWVAGWVLVYQSRVEADGTVDDSHRRYFVIRMVDAEQYEALEMDGTARSVDTGADLAEWPHTDNEDTARQAYDRWLEANPDAADEETEGEGEEDASEWSEWSDIQEVPPWWIAGREHPDGRIQFIIDGELDDGTHVYLAPDGYPQETRHVYDSIDDVQAALDAYFSNVANGDVPEDRQPNGARPSPDDRAADDGGSGLPFGIDETTAAVGAAAAVAGYIIINQRKT